MKVSPELGKTVGGWVGGGQDDELGEEPTEDGVQKEMVGVQALPHGATTAPVSAATPPSTSDQVVSDQVACDRDSQDSIAREMQVHTCTLTS